MSFERGQDLGAAAPLSVIPREVPPRRSQWAYLRQEVEIARGLFGAGPALRHALREAGFRLALGGAMRLDDAVLGRRLARVRVERPLFIIGTPRSGTSFLHSLLLSTDEMVAFKAWQLFWPALTGRRVISRAVALRKRFGATEVTPAWTGHRIDLDDYDEEEFLLHSSYDTPVKAAGILGLGEADMTELDFPDLLPAPDRGRALDLLDGSFRRQILATGRSQIVAQMHVSVMRLRSLMAYYPDARFVYVLRDPLQTVPSFLTLALNMLELRWGLGGVPRPVIDRFLKRRYRSMIGFYRYFHDQMRDGGLPRDRVMVLPYQDLTVDLRGAMDRLRDFSDVGFSADLEAHIDKVSASQSSYRRRHSVRSLEELGFSRRQLTLDFAFVYDRYDITPTAA